MFCLFDGIKICFSENSATFGTSHLILNFKVCGFSTETVSTEARESSAEQSGKFNCIIDSRDGNKSFGNWRLMSSSGESFCEFFGFITRKLFRRFPWSIRAFNLSSTLCLFIDFNYILFLPLLPLLTQPKPRKESRKSNRIVQLLSPATYRKFI